MRAVAANTFRETVREKVLYNLIFFAIILTLAGLVLRDLSIRQDAKILKDIGLAAIDLFGTAIAIFIGVGLVRKEIERRSLYPLLAKPLTRDEFLLGKFLGLALTLFVNVGAMTVGVYAVIYLTTPTAVDARLLEAVYAIFLSLLLVVAVALVLSTLSSSTVAAIGTLCLVLAGRYSDVLRGMSDVAPGVPSWLTRFLYFVLPNFKNFDFKDRVVHGESVAAMQLLWVSAYAAVYIVLLLGVAQSVFRRKDLE